jgi:hypothetical protein
MSGYLNTVTISRIEKKDEASQENEEDPLLLALSCLDVAHCCNIMCLQNRCN